MAAAESCGGCGDEPASKWVGGGAGGAGAGAEGRSAGGACRVDDSAQMWVVYWMTSKTSMCAAIDVWVVREWLVMVGVDRVVKGGLALWIGLEKSTMELRIKVSAEVNRVKDRKRRVWV
jgi:hypothetical protein